MTQEVTIDKKGRIVIPRRLREKLDLDEDGRVRLALEPGKIIITKPIPPEEFIAKMEGSIKDGSPLPKTDPLHLKKIWEHR